MAACVQLSDNLTLSRDRVLEHDSDGANNDFLKLPTVTVRGAKNLSIDSGCTSGSNSSGSESHSPASTPASTPASSPSTSPGSSPGLSPAADILHAMELNSRGTEVSANEKPVIERLDLGVDNMKEKFEDLSSNNNNLHFSTPTKEKLRYNRRSLVRSSSSACSSISEDMGEDASDESESDHASSSSTSSSPHGRPPLQRSRAIREKPGREHSPHRLLGPGSPRSASPVSTLEELETLSGVKALVRRPKKSQNGRSSPSWRWSVMGVATGDYDAIAKATRKGNHPSTFATPPSSTPPAASSAGNGNGHAPLSRRSSFGLSSTPTAVMVSPRTKSLSTEFRRLSLQMDMPWRDPNERLVKFADWLIKRTEGLMERSARARQKTYELLRLARQRQKDPIDF